MEVVWLGLPRDDALEVFESCNVLRYCAWLASDLSANRGPLPNGGRWMGGACITLLLSFQCLPRCS